ncbi:ester cyclase [Porticoccaceae bacterium]|nr:ester cyclase [Porticoccaceae bacterium]
MSNKVEKNIHTNLLDEKVKRNIEVWLQAFNCKYSNGDFATFLKSVSPDYQWNGSISIDYKIKNLSERQAFRLHCEKIKQGFPDIKLTHHMFGEGDLLGNYFLIEGSHLGDYYGVEPTKKSVKLFGVALARFDHKGQLLEEKELWEEVALLKQIDVIADKQEHFLVNILKQFKGDELKPIYTPNSLPEKETLLYPQDAIDEANRDPQVAANIATWMEFTHRKFVDPDFDTIEEVMSPDYHWRGPAGWTFDMKIPEQKEAARCSVESTNDSLRDLTFTSQRFGSGDMVLSLFVGEGVHVGEHFCVPATGRKLRWYNIAIGRFADDGRIIDEWELIDLLAIHKQMGLIEDNKENSALISVLKNL